MHQISVDIYAVPYSSKTWLHFAKLLFGVSISFILFRVYIQKPNYSAKFGQTVNLIPLCQHLNREKSNITVQTVSITNPDLSINQNVRKLIYNTLEKAMDGYESFDSERRRIQVVLATCRVLADYKPSSLWLDVLKRLAAASYMPCTFHRD